MYMAIHQGSLSSEIDGFARTRYYNNIVFDWGLHNIRWCTADIHIISCGWSSYKFSNFYTFLKRLQSDQSSETTKNWLFNDQVL